MTNWYFYEDDGQRQGAYSDGQLKWLAKNGIVTPDTLVESDEGGVSQAKKVRGLMFMDTTQKMSFWKAIDRQTLIRQRWYKFAIILAGTLSVFTYTGTWWVLLLCWMIWGVILAVFLTPIIVVNVAQEITEIMSTVMSDHDRY